MYDIAIIGGGINGCGIARDAAGRGYSVLLVEKGDLASGTSSGSTKLIHGGLRYLEHLEFRLVREALQEREVLLSIAPHVISPMRFVLPHHSDMRPAWLLRLGLFLYDHLASREILAASAAVDLTTAEVGEPLRPGFKKAFAYSDCWVDDARLVVLNARDAADRGAEIKTRTKCVRAVDESDLCWALELRNERTGELSTTRARSVINAAGPWIDQVLGNVFGRNHASNVRHVQGSHIIVPKLFDHEQAYIFQNDDGRILFAIPYENEFSLLGTTDREFSGELDEVEITEQETDYICRVASSYFKTTVTRDSVVWSYSAVRPLFDDGASAAQDATRDYVLKVESSEGKAPLINVFGGKITTYRRLAEAVLDHVDSLLDKESAQWTDQVPLPGGAVGAKGPEGIVAELGAKYPFLDDRDVKRLFNSYGTMTRDVLGQAKSYNDLGQNFGAGLTEREINYLRSYEWAETADDVLWRRSKFGLHMSRDERLAVEVWLRDQTAPALTP